MGDSSNTGYAMTSRHVEPHLIHDAMSIRERWRFVPLPEDFKQAVLFFNNDDDSETGDAREKHTSAFVRSGVGMDTEYGRFLQQALREGSCVPESPRGKMLKFHNLLSLSALTFWWKEAFERCG